MANNQGGFSGQRECFEDKAESPVRHRRSRKAGCTVYRWGKWVLCSTYINRNGLVSVWRAT